MQPTRVRLSAFLRPLLVTVGILVLLTGFDFLILLLCGLVSFGKPPEFVGIVSLCRDGKRGAAICRRKNGGSQRVGVRIVTIDATLRPPVRDLPCPESPPTAIARCSVSGRIFVGCDDGSLVLYEPPDASAPPALIGRHISAIDEMPTVHRIVLSNDGADLATEGNSNVVLWDVARRRQRLLEWEGRQLTCAAFLDRSILLTGTVDGEIVCWCTATGRPLGSLAALEEAITSIVVSPTGSLIAVIAEDMMLHVIDVETGSHHWSHHVDNPGLIAFSAGGKALAIRDSVNLGSILIFDAQTGAPRAALNACPSRIRTLVCTEDGSFIACDDGGTFWSRDVAGTECRWKLFEARSGPGT